MKGAPDKGSGLKLTQGVSGQAVAQQGFCVADLEAKHGPTFNLTQAQLDKTKDLTLILSMPIRKTKKMPDNTYILTDDIIGVVNIDSRMKGAYDYYQNTILYDASTDEEGLSLLDTQFQNLQKIMVLCSYVLSWKKRPFGAGDDTGVQADWRDVRTEEAREVRRGQGTGERAW